MPLNELARRIGISDAIVGEEWGGLTEPSSNMELQKKKLFILAFDSLSGLAAGTTTLVLAPFLQALHKWTIEFAHFIAFANIGYGIFSGTLFLIFKRNIQGSVWLVAALVAGNSVWAIQCFIQAWRLWTQASYFGLGHLVFEGVYVGMLAYVEAGIFLLAKDVQQDQQ